MQLLRREWLIQDSNLWIKHQFKNMRLTTCAFVWRGRLMYATICDKSEECYMIWNENVYFLKFIFKLFFSGIQFFFNFERMLYWYEIKAYIFKNLFYSYFLSL